MTYPHRRHAAAQSGFGLVEIMVGAVIGLIAVLVIYQVYNVAEGFKRNTTATGEAQQAGLFSAFVLGMELSNAGTGINVAAKELQWCDAAVAINDSFRPIPVLITDGGAPTYPADLGAPPYISDSFVVSYSVASTLLATAPFHPPAGPVSGSDPYPIQSPGGFHVGDLIVGIVNPSAAGQAAPTNCASSKVLAVGPPDADGIVTLTHTATPPSFTNTFSNASVLFNMGPCDRVQKVRYSVAGGVLYSTPLLYMAGVACGQPIVPPPPACPAAACTPLASNVVVMKAQYGVNVNCAPEQPLEAWLRATPATGYDPTTLLSALINCVPGVVSINKIKAVRIGIIVQSEQFDQSLAGFVGGDYHDGAYNWLLFADCPAADATCPGALTGKVPDLVNPPGNWRFRKYETVIPLRNVVWNPT